VKVSRWHDLLVAWLVGLVVLVVLNVLFHQVLAASFFYGRLDGIIVPAEAVKSRFVVADYAMLAVANLYLAAPVSPRRPRTRNAVTGAILGVVSFGTWNLINHAFVPRWPLSLVLIDTVWHAVAGAAAGLLMGSFLAWRSTSAARGQRGAR
jgi:uncharacterized membrane protein